MKMEYYILREKIKLWVGNEYRKLKNWTEKPCKVDSKTMLWVENGLTKI